jgi:hypothetical protein
MIVANVFQKIFFKERTSQKPGPSNLVYTRSVTTRSRRMMSNNIAATSNFAYLSV